MLLCYAKQLQHRFFLPLLEDMGQISIKYPYAFWIFLCIQCNSFEYGNNKREYMTNLKTQNNRNNFFKKVWAIKSSSSIGCHKLQIQRLGFYAPNLYSGNCLLSCLSGENNPTPPFYGSSWEMKRMEGWWPRSPSWTLVPYDPWSHVVLSQLDHPRLSWGCIWSTACVIN